jgi:hypothetical protein
MTGSRDIFQRAAAPLKVVGPKQLLTGHCDLIRTNVLVVTNSEIVIGEYLCSQKTKVEDGQEIRIHHESVGVDARR